MRGAGAGGRLALQPPQHAAHPRQQLARLEGLGQVVVGTRAEPGQPVGDRAGRGQHDDADRAAGAAQPFHDGKAVLARHVDVEDQDVGGSCGQQRVQFRAGAGTAHGEPVGAQIVLQQQPEIGLVVDDDDAGGAGHAASRRRRTSPRRAAMSSGFSNIGELGVADRLVELRPQRVAGDQDHAPGELGVALAQGGDQGRTVQVGHAQVADDDVEGLALQPQQRLAAAADDRDGQAVAAQMLGHELGDLGLVVDHQHAPARRQGRHRGGDRLGPGHGVRQGQD